MLEADIDDDVRAASMQKEHERLLVLQERTNDRLRELELANAEKAGLLRAALLDRENLPPELLELKRAETIQQMRERIESVIKAPPETQPKVLDATSSEIAETVLSSEAALDKAKKVSNDQISHAKSPSSAFNAAVSIMKRHQHESLFTSATVVSLASPQSGYPEKNKSPSEESAWTTAMGQTTLDRMAQAALPTTSQPPAMCNTECYMEDPLSDYVASLSLAGLPEYTCLGDVFLSFSILTASKSLG